MSDIWTTSWSETDASNSQTPPEGWPAGMFPNAVEPAARMNMGAVKRFWNRSNAVYAAQWNTADSYVATPSVAFVGYGLYERLRLRFTSANVNTSPSVNISSLGAQLVKRYDGAGNLVNPVAGDIQAQDHGIWWDGSRFILENPVHISVQSLVYATNAAQGSSTTVFLNSSAAFSLEANAQQPVPFSGTIRNLYVTSGGVPGTGQSYTFTVRKNGADTALTCAISDTGSAAQDTTHSVSVKAGDLLCVKLVTSSGANSGIMNASLQLGDGP